MHIRFFTMCTVRMLIKIIVASLSIDGVLQLEVEGKIYLFLTPTYDLIRFKT